MCKWLGNFQEKQNETKLKRLLEEENVQEIRLTILKTIQNLWLYSNKTEGVFL